MTVSEYLNSIHKYLNVHLKKRWSIIYDPKYGTNWIIDVKNKYWIIELKSDGFCWYRDEIHKEIMELYDTKPYETVKTIEKWVEKIFKVKTNGVCSSDYEDLESVNRVILESQNAR